MSRLRSDLLACLGFLLLPFALFWPVTVGGRTLVPADNLFFFEPWASARIQFDVLPPESPHNDLVSDLLLENYPWKRFIAAALDAGQLPLWNPHQFAGVPFLASGQHSALYPFGFIFYVPEVPLHLAYGWFIVSQFFLAGTFTYMLLRALGQTRVAAFAGGLVYEFSLFMIVSVVFPMIVAGAVWLPLILACIEWIVRGRPALGGRPASLPWAALGSVGLGCQILAGHPEVIYYTLLIAAGFTVWRLAGLQRPAGVGGLRQVVRPSLHVLAMAGLGIALGAAQLVPLFDVTRDNFRAGAATLDQVRGWAYPPRHALALLVPNVFGNPSHHGYFDLFAGRWTPVAVNALGQSILKIDWGIKNYVEGGAYVGILPLLLAALGVVSLFAPSAPAERGGRNARAFFAVLAALSLAFAFGTPLYALIYYLPYLNQLHSPFRWVWPFSLAIAALAGYGLDYVRGRRSRLTLAASGVCILAGAGLLAALVIVRLNFEAFEPVVARALEDLALAAEAFADPRMFFSYEAQWLGLLAGMLIASGVVLALAGRRAWRGWSLAAAALIAVDLLAAGAGFQAAADPSALSYTPPVVAFLQRDTSPWRFTTYDPDGRKPFNANLGWLFDLYDVRGYDSIIPKQYADYMSLIQPQGELQYNRIAPIDSPAGLESPLLDLLNVKYVVSLADIRSAKYRLVYDAEVKVYENLGVAPRAFTLPLGCSFASDDLPAALRAHDPRYFAIFEADEAGAAPTAPGPDLDSSRCAAAVEPAEISAYGINEVTVAVGPSGPGYLILADSYARGWRAFVRPADADRTAEREIPVRRVNGNFRAVLLEAGEQGQAVRFKYSPDAVKFGAFASAIAALALALALGMWLWRYFYRESPEESAAGRVARNSLAPMALTLMNRAIDLVFAAFMLRLLGPGDAGKYYFAIVLIGWFEIWTNFGLNIYLTREVARDRAHANRYLANTTLLRFGLGAASLPALGLLTLGLMRYANVGGDTALAIMLLAVGLAPSSISTGLTALFYAYEKAEYPAAISTVTTLLKVTFGALALLLGYSFVGLAAVTILVNTITMIVLIVLVVRLFFVPRYEFEPQLQRTMISESWPLMLNHLLATLFFKVDVALLQPIRGAVEVGWYSTAYKFVEAYNIIPAFFTFALFPVVSRQAREDRPGLTRSYALAVKLLVTTALPLAVVTTFLARTLIGLLAGDEFLPHGAIALVLMVWSIPVGWINSVTNYVLIALGQQRALTRAFAIGLTFNIVANLIFIPSYGYAAAGVITILSEIVEGIPFYLTLHRALAPVPWLRLLWRPALSAAAMAGLTWAGWQIHPLLGLALGGAAYLGLIAGLRVFDDDERAQFLSALPSGIRSRLAQREPGDA